MNTLSLEDIREEINSLLHESIKEFQKAESQVGVSLLVEAQFLLGEAIQHELNKIHRTPSLSLVGGEWAEGHGGLAHDNSPSTEVLVDVILLTVQYSGCDVRHSGPIEELTGCLLLACVETIKVR